MSTDVLLDRSYLRQIGQNCRALGVKDHDALVEVVVLHGRSRVELGKTGAGLDLERIVRAAVVQIMAQASDHQG